MQNAQVNSWYPFAFIVLHNFHRDGKSVDAKENQLFVSIFLTVSEGGNSVIKHWYQFGYQERPNVKMRIWNGALRRFVELVRIYI